MQPGSDELIRLIQLITFRHKQVSSKFHAQEIQPGKRYTDAHGQHFSDRFSCPYKPLIVAEDRYNSEPIYKCRTLTDISQQEKEKDV